MILRSFKEAMVLKLIAALEATFNMNLLHLTCKTEAENLVYGQENNERIEPITRYCHRQNGISCSQRNTKVDHQEINGLKNASTTSTLMDHLNQKQWYGRGFTIAIYNFASILQEELIFIILRLQKANEVSNIKGIYIISGRIKAVQALDTLNLSSEQRVNDSHFRFLIQKKLISEILGNARSLTKQIHPDSMQMKKTNLQYEQQVDQNKNDN